MQRSPSGRGASVQAADSLRRAGLDPDAIDARVAPCRDFYAFACGGWEAATEIPKDALAWSRGVGALADRNEAALRQILEAMARGERGSVPYARELGDLYASCMDREKVESTDVGPLREELAKIEVRGEMGLARALAALRSAGLAGPFALDPAPDPDDARQVIARISQTVDAPLSERGERYVAATLTLLGDPHEVAARKAKTIASMDRALASAALTPEARRDPARAHHRMTRAALARAAPGLRWGVYLDALGIPAATPLDVATVDLVTTLSEMARSFSSGDWETYLRWHVVDAYVVALPSRFVEAEQHAKRGVKLPARWKRCVDAVGDLMPDALGQAFGPTVLDPKRKADVLAMVTAMQESLARDVAGATWLDGPSRDAALEKITRMGNVIGYPDAWRGYDGLTIDRGAFFENVQRARGLQATRDLRAIGAPKSARGQSVPMLDTNAFYYSAQNMVVLPAAILQPPFFGASQARAVNLGALGTVVGHELIHALDDAGRRYDADGNLVDAWSVMARAAFEKRAECLVRQFEGVSVEGRGVVNGRLTLGENIADLGGLRVAYAALEASLAHAPGESVASYTPRQQFFLAYAQQQCARVREPLVRGLVRVDAHAPPKLRVNGPLSNLRAFAEAFSCKASDRMVRADELRCEVW